MEEFEALQPGSARSVARNASRSGQFVIIPAVFTTDERVCLIDRILIDGTRWKLPTALASPHQFEILSNSIASLLNLGARITFGNAPNKPTVRGDMVTDLGVTRTLPPSEAYPVGACILPHVVEFDYPEGDARLKGSRKVAPQIGAIHWLPFDRALTFLGEHATDQDPGSVAAESLAVYVKFYRDFTELEPVSSQDLLPSQMASA